MPDDPEPRSLPRGASEEERQAYWERHEAWQERFDAWRQTPEGAGWDAHLESVRAQIDAWIREAEDASARTCESCGAPGGIWCDRARSPWYVTSCERCAPPNYIREAEWRRWHRAMQPEWNAKARRDLLAAVGRTERLLATGNTRYHLAEATWAATPEEAVAALESGQIREVLLGDDPVGQAAIAWLRARYADHDPRQQTARSNGAPGMTIIVPPDDAPVLIPLSPAVDVAPLRELGLRTHSGGFVRLVYGEDAFGAM